MPFDLNFHLHRLLRKEPFFAAFSRRIEKCADSKIPTAAIAFNRETQRFSLLYNSDFMESLSDEHKVGVLKHEFYHLILKHLTARVPFDPMKEPEKAKVWNVVADLAINTTLLMNFQVWPVPGQSTFCVPQKLTLNMEDKESGTGPYEPSDNGEAQEPGSFDDHSTWGNPEEDQQAPFS